MSFYKRLMNSPLFMDTLASVLLASACILALSEIAIVAINDLLIWVQDSIVFATQYKPETDESATLMIAYVIFYILTLSAYFLMIRKFFFFPLTALLQAAVLIFAAIFTSAALTAPILLSFAALILLLPEMYAKSLLKLGDSNVGISRVHLQAVAIPAAIISVIISQLVIPKDTSAWQSALLNYWISDIYTYINGPYQQTNYYSSEFGLSRVGYSSDSGQLGGAVTLGDEKYLQVWTDKPLLLRGKIMDYYDGHSFNAKLMSGDFRLKSPLWHSIKKDTFGTDLPTGSKETAGLFKKLVTETTFTVYALTDDFNSIFTAQAFSSLKIETPAKKSEPYFNNRSEIFLHTRFRNIKYTVTSNIFQTNDKNFDDLFMQLEATATDPKRYAEVSERYTQLPADLPKSVCLLAKSITQEANTPYQKAAAISRFLSENAEYSLTPETPPPDMDFIAHFLETRIGHCEYFAAAMTVMARCAGLPARYVTGFALERDAENDCYYATQKSAHAWSEVYFEGIGWLPMDPLNAVSGDLNSGLSSDYEEITIAPITPLSEDETLPEPTGMAKTGGSPVKIIAILVLGGLFIYAICRYLLYFIPKNHARKWSMHFLRKRFLREDMQLNALYSEILILLSMNHIVPLPAETPEAFGKRTDRLIVFDDYRFGTVAAAMTALHFRGDMPGADMIEAACGYHKQLDLYTLESAGRFRYCRMLLTYAKLLSASKA